MEKTIRVLVANRPRLMRELIVATFADQPDIEIVGEIESASRAAVLSPTIFKAVTTIQHAPLCERGNHRLGSGQRIPRRHFHLQAHSVRPLLSAPLGASVSTCKSFC
jgi:hypothetical protein